MFEKFSLFVLDTIKRYHRQFLKDRVLRTPEEVAANTNEDNLASAVVVGELYNNLANGQVKFSIVDGKLYVKVGADAARPFSSIDLSNFKIFYSNTSSTGAKTITVEPGFKFILCASATWSDGSVKIGASFCDVNSGKVVYFTRTNGGVPGSALFDLPVTDFSPAVGTSTNASGLVMDIIDDTTIKVYSGAKVPAVAICFY